MIWRVSSFVHRRKHPQIVNNQFILRGVNSRFLLLHREKILKYVYNHRREGKSLCNNRMKKKQTRIDLEESTPPMRITAKTSGQQRELRRYACLEEGRGGRATPK